MVIPLSLSPLWVTRIVGRLHDANGHAKSQGKKPFSFPGFRAAIFSLKFIIYGHAWRTKWKKDLS